jgi:hypothetical protein
MRRSAPQIKLRNYECSGLNRKVKQVHAPANDVLGLLAEVNIVGEDEVVRPVDDLLVRLVRRLGAERWVTDEALEHDRAE